MNREENMDNSLEIVLEELEKILEEVRDGKIDIEVILKEFTEIKQFLRHIHNDVEIIRIESYIQNEKFKGLVFALGDKLGLDKKAIEQAIHSDPDVRVEAERAYSPIDLEDKIEWEEYIKQKREKN